MYSFIITAGFKDGREENSSVGIILGTCSSFLVVIIIILLIVFVAALVYKHKHTKTEETYCDNSTLFYAKLDIHFSDCITCL